MKILNGFLGHTGSVRTSIWLYSQDFTDPDYLLRQVDLPGDFSSYFNTERTTMSIPVQTPNTHTIMRTIDTPNPDFLGNNGFTASMVEVGFGGVTFANLSPQMLYLQEEEVPVGQNPVLEDYTALWRLPNSGALFFIADYEFPRGSQPAEFTGQTGRAEIPGLAADGKYSIPIFTNLGDFESSTDTAGAMMKVGQHTRHSWVSDGSQVDATATTGGWRGWRNKITIEVLAYAPSMDLEAHGSMTTVTGVLALRFTHIGYEVIGDSASGPWWRDEMAVGGEMEETILFFSPGLGLFMDAEWGEENDSYCVDAGNGMWIWDPDDNANCDSAGIKHQYREWNSVFVATAFEGFNDGLLPQPAPIKFTVTSSNSEYKMTGGGASTGAFPAITLQRGMTYEFDIQVESSHPFKISDSQRGAAYNDGMDQDQPASGGMTSGMIRWTVPQSAPNNMHYYCTVHSFMNGTITIVD